MLWLSSWMVHNANHLRPARDGLKVGGHQASCASVATIMTALYFDVLGPNDRVAVKPHASPVFHAIQYLFGNQTKDQAGGVSGLRRCAELSLAHQGQRRRGHFHRLGRARGGDDALRLHGPGLRALPQARAGKPRPRSHDRRSWAMPSSTRAMSSKRFWRDGSTMSATSGGSSTITARASTVWSPTGCSRRSRTSSRRSAGRW